MAVLAFIDDMDVLAILHVMIMIFIFDRFRRFPGFPFPKLFPSATVAGGTWGMEGSGANEDTFPSPVISALDAELTYLQKSWGPCASKISKRFSDFTKAGVQVLTMFSTMQMIEIYMDFVLNQARSDMHWQRCHQSCVCVCVCVCVCACLSLVASRKKGDT